MIDPQQQQKVYESFLRRAGLSKEPVQSQASKALEELALLGRRGERYAAQLEACRDVTQRRRVEKKLEAVEDRETQIAEYLDDEPAEHLEHLYALRASRNNNPWRTA